MRAFNVRVVADFKKSACPTPSLTEDPGGTAGYPPEVFFATGHRLCTVLRGGHLLIDEIIPYEKNARDVASAEVGGTSQSRKLSKNSGRIVSSKRRGR